MPAVAYAKTARVTVHQNFYGEEAVNVFHVMHDEALPLSIPEMSAIADEFDKMYNDLAGAAVGQRGMLDARHPAATVDVIRVYDLTIVPNPPPFEKNLAISGTAAHTTVPVEVCVATTLRTAVGSRRGRGRVYLGPFGAAAYLISSSGQAPQVGSVTFIANAFLDLNTRLAASALLNNARLGVLSVTDGLIREVTEVKIDHAPDTQRRRGLGVPYLLPTVQAI